MKWFCETKSCKISISYGNLLHWKNKNKASQVNIDEIFGDSMRIVRLFTDHVTLVLNFKKIKNKNL